MHGSKKHCQTYQFGDFSFNSETLELKKCGNDVDLKFQPARLLKILVEHSPEVVMRQTLQDEIWDNGTTVEFEAGLNACVNQLRSVLGDSARAPQFIATLPKRGYRFVAPVEFESKTTVFRRALRFLPTTFVALLVVYSLYFSDPSREGGASMRADAASVQTMNE